MFVLVQFVDSDYGTRIVHETDIRGVRKSTQVKVKCAKSWRLATVIARHGKFSQLVNK